MSMTDWAKEEVRIAIEKENVLSEEHTKEDAEYATAVYEAALAGYLAVFDKEPGMTGQMVGFTREIVDRLFRGQPLSPIEDTSDQWNEVGPNMFQSRRMSSLFKTTVKDKDGNEQIIFHDNERAHGYDINQEIAYQGGVINPIIDEMFPIKMPYMPPTGAIRVYTESFQFEESKDSDFDTIGVLYLKMPGYPDPMQIMRFFREAAKAPVIEECRYPGWVEIQQDEYMKRKADWFKRTQGDKAAQSQIVGMDGHPLNREQRRAQKKGGK